MSIKDATGDDEISDLPDKPTIDSVAADVKGGATPGPPSGPVPIPYPNVKPASPRGIHLV